MGVITEKGYPAINLKSFPSVPTPLPAVHLTGYCFLEKILLVPLPPSPPPPHLGSVHFNTAALTVYFLEKRLIFHKSV